MAIAFLSKTEFNYTTSTTNTWSFSHLVERGQVSALVVTVYLWAVGAATTVASVTYAGITVTKIVEATEIGDDGSCSTPVHTAIFVLASPPPCAKDSVVITSSANCYGCSAIAANYTGSSRTSPVRASNSAFSDSDYCGGTALQTMTVGVTSAVGDLVIGSVCFFGGGTPAYDLGTDETERSFFARSGSAAPKILVLEKAGASGTVTLSDLMHTADPQDYGWSFSIISLAPDAAAAPVFTHKTPFTVAAAQVPSAQTDFVALIAPSDARFKTVSNGGHVQNANGYDIRAYSDADLTTPLVFEFAKLNYSPTAGTFEMWVKLSSIDVGTIVYLACGDATLDYDYSDIATWSSHYKLAIHGGNASTLSVLDSSGNTVPLNVGTTAIGGKIGGAIACVQTSKWLAISSHSALDGQAAKSISFWMYPTESLSSGQYRWLWFEGTGGSGYGIVRIVFQSWDGSHLNLIEWTVEKSGGGNYFTMYAGNGEITANAWNHVMVVHNASTAIVYVNSINKDSALPSGSLAADSGGNIAIGLSSAQGFNGYIDEIHFSDVLRAQDWITTEYKNQNAPNTFWSMGVERQNISIGYQLGYHR